MADDNLGFNIQNLMDAQAEQDKRRKDAEAAKTAATTATQAVTVKGATASIDALTKARGVKAASDTIANNNLKAQQYLMDDSAELARIEQEAITLSNSGKPGDKLTLWMKQLSDPRYTHQYNSIRQSKITQTSDTMNHFDTMRQQAYTRQLEAIQSDLDLSLKKDQLSLLPVTQQLEMANLIKDQGDSAVKSLSDAINTRHTVIAEDVAMQDNVLSNLTNDQIKEVQAKAKDDPSKSTVVGGVKISLGTLDRVAGARDDQDYLSMSRQLETEAKNRTAAEAAAKIRRTKYLQTMSPGELNRLQLDGGTLTYPDGAKEVFDLEEVKKFYDLKKSNQDADILNQSQLAGIGDGRSIVTEHADFLSHAPESKPGSSVWNAQVTYMDVIRRSAQSMTLATKDKPADDPMVFDTARVVYDALHTARTQYETEIEKEAKRVGNGNEFRTNLERARLRGEPMQPDLIEAEVTSRAINGKPLTDLLGSEQSAAFLKSYNESLTDIQNREGQVGGLSTPDRKAMQQEAAAIAYTKVVTAAAQKTADAQTPLQVLDPSHPLFQKVTPAEFSQLESESDAQGVKEFMAAKGLTAKEMDDLKAGKRVRDVKPEDLGEIPVHQQSALFGRVAAAYGFQTAEDIATWWGGSKGAAFVEKRQEALNADSVSKAGPDYVTSSASNGMVGESLNWYGRSVQAGIRDFQNDRIIREMSNFRAFGNNPQALQVTILDHDKSLSDFERQEVYNRFIDPLLADAKQKGLDYETTNTFIEKSLRALNPEDARSKALIKKILRTREETIDTIGAVVKNQAAAFDWSAVFSMSGGAQGHDELLRQNQGLKDYNAPPAWYTQMLKDREAFK